MAQLDLSNLSHDPGAISSIGQPFALICLIYLLCFAIYFWISRVNYLRRMQLSA